MESKVTGCASSQEVPMLRVAPVCQSLASQVMNTLSSPRLAWSMVVRHSWLITRALIPSNTFWCSRVHGGKLRHASFIVRGVRTHVKAASFGRNTEIYHTKPRKERTSVVFFGTGHCKILSTFDVFASIPQ